MATTKTQKTRTPADAFLEHQAAIAGALYRLQTLAIRRFNFPADVNWAHVGTVAHFRRELEELVACGYGEGEYAAPAEPARYTAFDARGRAVRVTVPDKEEN